MEVELIKKNKNKKKIVSIITLILLTLVVVIGGSNALFSYANKNDNQSVIAGDIYMKASGNKFITASVTPMSTKEGMEKGEKYNFSIEGYNDSKKDIYYGIYINYGEEQENKQRFNDEDIMIYLTETKEGVTKDVFGPGRLSDFNNNMIYASTIDSNIKKEDKVTRDYELTVWLSDNVLISDTETNWEGKNIYTSEEYKNSYLSLDVKVEGDFVEKGVEDGKVSITAVTATSNTPYDLTTSPESDEDVKVTLTSTKELEKIILINTSTGEKEELTPTENKVEKVISSSGKYRYYGIFKDGKISATEEFTVNLLSDKTNTLNKPTNAICIERVYNGESQELVKETKGYSLENNTGINATTYQVKVKLNEGYTWNDETTSDITIECEIKPKDVEVEWNIEKYTYTGEPLGPTASAIGVKDEVLTIETTKETDAGSHVSTATLTKVTNGQAEVKNYNLTNNTKDYEIEKAVPELTLEPVSGSVRANEEITFKATSNVEGTFKVTSSSISNATATLTPSTGKTTTVTVSGKELGEADIEVQFESTNPNYSSNKKTYQVTVTEGIKEATLGSCKENLIYDGTSQTLINEGVGVTYNKTAGTNAGDYQITVTPKAGYEFENKETSKTLNCSIAKKDVAITAKAQTINYNSSISKTASDITTTGLITNHTVTDITLTPSTSSVTTTGTITPSNATIKDSSSTEVTSNYNITYKDGNLTIKALTATMGTCYSRTYNGSSQTLIGTGTGVTYSSSSASVSSSGTSVTATSAGDYTITATAKTGYAFASGATTSRTCTISKRSLTITAIDQTITYGGSIGTGPSYITTGDDELVSGHSVYSVSLSKSTSSVTSSGTITPSNAVIKAGTSSSSTTVTSNYDITYQTGKLTINKVTPVLTLSSESGSTTVNGTISFIASAKVNNNDVTGTYTATSVSSSIAMVSVSGNKITITGKGSGTTNIIVGFNPTDTTNYNSAISKTYSVSVKIKTGPANDVVKDTAVIGVTDTCTDFTTKGGLVAINTDGTLYQEGSGQKIREYRYVGPDVDNYIYFNCLDNATPSSANCEIWRILGIFKDEEENEHIKIVRNNVLPRNMYPATFSANGITYKIQSTDSSGEYVYWNYPTSGTRNNDWATAGLQYWLNAGSDKETKQPSDGYMSYLSKSAKELIAETKYYLGNFNYQKDTITNYTYERGNTTCSGSCSGEDVWEGNQATWNGNGNGNIALMYPSDVRYASNSCSWTFNLSSGNGDSNANWLYKTANHSTDEWLLSPSYDRWDGASSWGSDGTILNGFVDYDNSGARPVLNLKSTVKISEGSGTSSSPYVLSYTSSSPSVNEGPGIVDENIGTNKTASIGSCNNLVYNGEEQTLVSGGRNVTYSNNTGIDAGTYIVTANTKTGYFFNDGSTSKTLTCTIEKKAVTVNYSNNEVKYTGGLVSPIATATGVKGENIELETTKETNVGDYTMITTMKNVNPNYTLRNTVYDYKIVDKDVKENNDIKTTYKVNYYLMNKDLVNYTLVKSNSYDAKVGDIISPKVLEFSGYKSPKSITIEIIEGLNIINYYYERI